MVKQHVFELLSALCLYSSQGYQQVIDALENFKLTKGQRYRFSLIINELKNAEDVPYMTMCLAFINTIIIATEDFQERLRLRNELAGLGLLDILNKLRHNVDEKLLVQLDAFEEQRLDDEEELSSPEGIYLTSHLDVFHALFRKVINKPEAVSLLSILQNLLLIEDNSPVSDLVWEVIEKLVKRAVNIESATQINALLEAGETELLPLESGGSLKRQFSDERSNSQDENLSQQLSVAEHSADDVRSACICSVSDDEHGSILIKADKVYKQIQPLFINTLLEDTCQVTVSDKAPDSSAPVKILEGTIQCKKNAEDTEIPYESPVSPPTGLKGAEVGPSRKPPPTPGNNGITPPPTLPVLCSVPLPGMGGVPLPPPLPGIGGAPLPPPLPGIREMPLQPSLSGMEGLPPPPHLPGMGGVPSPPPLLGMGGTPPPPPPPLPGMGRVPAPVPPPGVGGVPPPPPPPPPGGFGVMQQSFSSPLAPAVKPKSRMRSLAWQKLTPDVLGRSKTCVWTRVLALEVVQPDFSLEEEWFCQKKVAAKKTECKAKELSEITLLDPKRSLNINIFMKQFQKTNEEIVSLIQKGDSHLFDVDVLKSFIKLLPDKTEREMLETYPGDKAQLGSAEKFFLAVVSIPGYSLRLEAMLQKEEFRIAMETIKPSIEALQGAIEAILESETLPEILQLILIIGNFLNSGGYAGNAVAFKIKSLLRIVDTRANKPRMNLMHFLVHVAKEKREKVLQFPDDMKYLDKAVKVSVDNITQEVKTLNSKLNNLKKAIVIGPEDISPQFSDFIEDALKKVKKLEEGITHINILAKQLALYFCEDEGEVKLQELLSLFKTFCDQLVKAKEENEQFKLKENKLRAREKKQEKEADQKCKPCPLDEEQESCIVDRLLSEIREGFPLRKSSRTTPVGQGSKSASPRARLRSKEGGGKDFAMPELAKQVETDTPKTDMVDDVFVSDEDKNLTHL